MMVENNERIVELMKGGHEKPLSYGSERKHSGSGAFVPAYKRNMFAPKFKENKKYA